MLKYWTGNSWATSMGSELLGLRRVQSTMMDANLVRLKGLNSDSNASLQVSTTANATLLESMSPYSFNLWNSNTNSYQTPLYLGTSNGLPSVSLGGSLWVNSRMVMDPTGALVDLPKQYVADISSNGKVLFQNGCNVQLQLVPVNRLLEAVDVNVPIGGISNLQTLVWSTIYNAFVPQSKDPNTLVPNKLLVGDTSCNILQPAQLHWDNSNVRLGIGTSVPLETLHVVGSILATQQITSYSDARFKSNVRVFSDALECVSRMRGVRYEDAHAPHRSKVGVIAQEMEAVVPEVVATNDEGYKSVAYGEIAAVLIEAVKELRVELNDVKRELALMKKASL